MCAHHEQHYLGIVLSSVVVVVVVLIVETVVHMVGIDRLHCPVIYTVYPLLIVERVPWHFGRMLKIEKEVLRLGNAKDGTRRTAAPMPQSGH